MKVRSKVQRCGFNHLERLNPRMLARRVEGGMFEVIVQGVAIQLCAAVGVPFDPSRDSSRV